MSNRISNIADTTKDRHFVLETDLCYIQNKDGVKESGFKRYVEELDKTTRGEKINPKDKDNIYNRSVRLYRENIDGSLVAVGRNLEAEKRNAKIGALNSKGQAIEEYFSFVLEGQNFGIDKNKNLLLKTTSGGYTEDEATKDGGNCLLNKEGKVLWQSDTDYAHPAVNGVYSVDHFARKGGKETHTYEYIDENGEYLELQDGATLKQFNVKGIPSTKVDYDGVLYNYSDYREQFIGQPDFGEFVDDLSTGK